MVSAPAPAPSLRRLQADDDTGITALWVALLLVAMMMFAALAIDGGQAYQSHRQSQNASDAGAMAGVRVLTKLKFGTWTDTTLVGTEVLQQARNTQADTTSGGVQCYAISFTKVRQTSDLCTGASTTISNAQLAASYGVEVVARQTKATTFARVVGYGSTAANTTARAMIQSYAGNNGTPFVVCGSQADYPTQPPPSGWSYDILAKDSSTSPATYTVKSQALNKYYTLQASQVPTCGGSSASFKGLAGASGITLDQWSPTTPGNGASASIADAVVGITACTQTQISSGQFDGCGLSIPISTRNQASGSNMDTYAVLWTVWQVWGDGTGGYPFNGIGGNGPGQGCQKPYDGYSNNPSSLKYCGLLLGSQVLASGAGDTSGPPVSGASLVLKMVD